MLHIIPHDGTYVLNPSKAFDQLDNMFVQSAKARGKESAISQRLMSLAHSAYTVSEGVFSVNCSVSSMGQIKQFKPTEPWELSFILDRDTEVAEMYKTGHTQNLDES